MKPDSSATTLVTLLLTAQILSVWSFGAEFLCNRIPGLTPKQRLICQSSPDAMAVMGEGTRLGIAECQHQFRFSRWNCTAIGTHHTYAHVLVVGSREAAFLYAVSSAGVTYAITQACARGNLSSCGCAPPTTISTSGSGGSPAGGLSKNEWGVASGWRWGGCSADVGYAVKLARKFMDSREIEGDARSLMNLHNNKAGRKAVEKTLETECKCHGVSGSCTLKTCWLKLTSFRRIGEKLLEKYQKARPVVAVQGVKGPRSRRSLMLLVRARHALKKRNPAHPDGAQHNRNHVAVGSETEKKPRKADLVYLEQSPNYCDSDWAVGSLGTRGRRCLRRTGRGNSSAVANWGNEGQDSCDILCCGRGYNTHQIWRKWKCECKFRWCCEVECRNCEERVEIYTCN